VIGARWSEINFAARMWTVPTARMKSGREHRVPLTAAAMLVLKRMQKEDDEFLFPGTKAGQGLFNMALLKVLERMGRGDLTAHGFRATFKTWATERTNFPREVTEAALAHAIEDKVEAAYRRSDLFDKRRRLMDAWDEFCGKHALRLPLRVLALCRLHFRCKCNRNIAAPKSMARTRSNGRCNA